MVRARARNSQGANIGDRGNGVEVRVIADNFHDFLCARAHIIYNVHLWIFMDFKIFLHLGASAQEPKDILLLSKY